MATFGIETNDQFNQYPTTPNVSPSSGGSLAGGVGSAALGAADWVGNKTIAGTAGVATGIGNVAWGVTGEPFFGAAPTRYYDTPQYATANSSPMGVNLQPQTQSPSYSPTGTPAQPTYAPGVTGEAISAQPSNQAPSPAGAPLATAPTDPRLAQLNDIQTQAQTIQDSLNAGLDPSGSPVIGSFDQFQGQDPFDEERQQTLARRAQLRLHQAEIDATNQIYDEQLNQARLQGEGRLGSTRAIGARGGILGSDFASSQKQEQITANNAQQRAIQAERQAKIGAIMGNVRSSVLADMEDRRQAYSLGADALLANISGQAAKKQANVQQFAGDLIAQGFDITDLDEEELKAIASEAGVSTRDLISGFSRAKAGIATEADTKKYTLKEGETLVNAAGETLASIAGEPVVYKEGDTVIDADGNERKFGKTTADKAAGSDTGVYSSKNLPPEMRSEFINVYAANPDASIVDMALTFPEIEAETLQQMYDDYGPEGPAEEGFDWKFWDSDD